MRHRDDGITEQASFAKRRDLENHLGRGMTQIVLDSHCSGVDLPAHLMGQDQVVLNLSYAFHLRIFEIDLDGVQASLSFSGQEYLCIIPWKCVYFIRLASGEEEGSMYLESMPLSMREHLMKLAGLDLEDLDESDDDDGGDSSFDLSTSIDDADLPPIVTPTPPRPTLRRADQVSDDSLDEDSSWLEQLPLVSSSIQQKSHLIDDEAEDDDESEDEPISFTEFLKKKGTQS